MSGTTASELREKESARAPWKTCAIADVPRRRCCAGDEGPTCGGDKSQQDQVPLLVVHLTSLTMLPYTCIRCIGDFCLPWNHGSFPRLLVVVI